MTPGAPDRQRGIWETPECPFRIEYAAGMLNQIRMAAVEAYYSVPHGGVEIGGVLFGSSEPGRVVIRNFRRIECEYASGPSFALSERDLEALERLLRETETDPSLAGQRRVGWFHSHTRSEMCLTEADLDIYHGFFPGPMDVALVLRPAHLQPTRAGFFFRDEEGQVHAESSYREFIADPAYLETFTTDEPQATPRDEVRTATPAPALPGFNAEQPESVAVGLPPTVRHVGLWIAAAALAGVLASAAVTALWRPRLISTSAAAKAPGLALEGVELDGEAVLRWNRESPLVRHAVGGLLDIRDGDEQKQIKLQPEDVRRGVALYRRTSPRAEFRLRAWQAGQPPVEESLAIAGALPEAVADAPAGAQAPKKQPSKAKPPKSRFWRRRR